MVLAPAQSGDPDGNLEAYKWEKVSGAAATISGATTPELALTRLVAGEICFQDYRNR